MIKFQDILIRIGAFIKRTFARQLAKMYVSCRETSSYIDGKNKREIEYRCQVIEDLCHNVGVYIPDKESGARCTQSSLLRRYMAWRFNWDLRITIYKGKTTLEYMEIPLRKLEAGKTTDINKGLCIWDKLVLPPIEKANSVHLPPKPAVENRIKKESESVQNQPIVQTNYHKMGRLINPRKVDSLNEEELEQEDKNTVEIDGIIIDNSF